VALKIKQRSQAILFSERGFYSPLPRTVISLSSDFVKISVINRSKTIIHMRGMRHTIKSWRRNATDTQSAASHDMGANATFSAF
jgi:hypothetical protein